MSNSTLEEKCLETFRGALCSFGEEIQTQNWGNHTNSDNFISYKTEEKQTVLRGK